MNNPSIIYQDNEIVAVNKPAGLVVHRANLKNQISRPQRLSVAMAGAAKIKNKEKELFLTDWLVKNFPEIKKVGDEPELRPGIVHRLDKDTSGVLVVAKNQSAFEYLKSLFQNREIIKKYLVLVEGNLKTDKGVIDLPIGRSRSDFRKKLASGNAKGELREAITEYKILERFTNVQHRVLHKVIHYTLVEAYPKTGRTHQIRTHFKAIRHPVVCDSLYGGKKARCPFGLGRHFLHANFLEFNLLHGGRIKLEADIPKDMKDVLRALRKKE